MASPAVIGRRKLGWWAALGLVILFTCRGVGQDWAIRAGHWLGTGLEAIRALGPECYFLVMAVIPLPLSWFTVPAGEVFAETMTLSGVIVAALTAVAVQLALSYWAGWSGLRPVVEHWVRRSGREVPQVSPGEAWRVILLVRLTPGPPMILGSALLAVSNVPFGLYMVISWLVALPWVVGGVVMGRGLLGGDWGLLASGAGALIAAGLATRFILRSAKEGTCRGPEMFKSPAMSLRDAPGILARQKTETLAEARRVIRGLKGGAAGLDARVKDMTVIVKTFERPACVAMCLASVRACYPTVPILVCDDGRETLFADGEEPAPGIRWLTLPFEAGHTLGAGRNHLLRMVTTPFFFLADDDHAFTAHTRLESLAGVMRRHRLDIAGGAQDRGDYGGAIFERKGDLVYQRFHEFHEELEAGVVRCDRVSNTFLARTEAVRAIGWEERVHGSEHADFFLRASGAGLRIAQVGYVYVDHRRDCETPTGWVGRCFGRWVAHRDRSYAWLRRGGDQGGADWLEREREFVHKKNGIRAIVDVHNRSLRRRLEARIGTPYYGCPPFADAL